MRDDTEHDFYPRDGALAMQREHWPDGKPLAVAFVVSAEYYDLYPSAEAFTPPSVPGGFGRGPYPDYRAFSMREYGNRVGAFRLMDLFSRHGLRATLAADAFVAQHRRPVIERALNLGWDLAGHGLSVTDVISSRMSEERERDYVAESLRALQSASGRTVKGWHGPEYGESARTPRLLAEAGVRYLMDWPHDERPVPLDTGSGVVLSLPMSADLDDVMAHWHRRIPMHRWVQCVIDAVERLAMDGAHGGRLLLLNLHPWLSGQPYRVSYLNELLGQLTRRTDIWFTTTDEVAARSVVAPVATTGGH
ncbi:polysaccharide deacetylase family protein [Hydrogenophaga sp.]|uniref:polysaccharide deacetylase family protein n=1 Tax=Hydrogenophaga sp. TaxID=1904254 RepID=UPI003F72AE45